MDKDRENIKKMATQVQAMEGKYDSSMRGKFLDLLVSEYVSLKAGETVDMFDTIMREQKDVHDTYGDIDTAATKLKLSGTMKPRYHGDNYETSISAMFLDDIFCGEKFVIFKVVISPNDWEGEAKERFTEKQLHIRKVEKAPKKANLDLIQYGDLRDNGYCVSLISKYGREFEVQDGRGMVYYYPKFEAAFRALREIKLELVG